jgi:hypothetical protein
MAVAMVTALVACGGQNPPTGATAPAKPGGAGPAGASASGATAASGAGSADAVDDSPQAAAQAVTGYFTEINDASRAGRVADVSATALPGCQTCALDIGATRQFSGRGLHTDVAPYQLADLRAGNRAATTVVVRFTATVRAVRLLDLAGRQAGTDAGVQAKSGVAQLTLTSAGWRIHTIEYSPGPT